MEAPRPAICSASVMWAFACGRPVAAQYSRRFSAPDRCGRKPGPSTKAPIRASTGAPGSTVSPNAVIEPAVGRISPISMRSTVVLPAPLGPSSPSTMPGSTSNDTPFTALNPPLYVLARSRTCSGRPPSEPATTAVRWRPSARPASQPSSASPSTTPIPIAGPSGMVLAVTDSPGTTGTLTSPPTSSSCQTAGSGVEV